MPSSAHPSAGDAPLLQTLSQDVRQLLVDVRRTGVRRTFSHTFDDLESFYLSEDRQKRLARMKRPRRLIFMTLWLLKSLFLKLTSARRVLLLFAFVMLWAGYQRVNVVGHVTITGDLRVLGVASLILVLMLELKDKLLFRTELEAGRAVQQALLPSTQPQVRGWDVWLSTRPANEVGGDLVDHLPLAGEGQGLVLADVAGKGLGAALVMARLQALVRALAPETESLARLGERLNTVFRRDRLTSRFATLVCLAIEPGCDRVRLLNAGHMPPLLVRDGLVTELARGGAALGITPDGRYDEQTIQMQPGDVLVVYSDGVTEAMDQVKDFFGDDRLRAALARLSFCPTAQIARELLAEVERFVADAPWHDDLSLIVLKRV